ncbi:type II toxin-antitoxin system VapB family antitoxin [uncultured Paraglaciecola sp.]|uniref:type II toxin-antitoxin system VapB family antitoxin n=1 Tax=uncultured Paraglaciecola sp. TaxID=1765024 RepID=UPI00260FCA89|nr:type II toxin-antitoxin system VapB family antitoxin [uncultured Paraglaciecola sp.]
MRTTISIEDELFEQAAQFCPPNSDKASVIREAMKVFVRLQAAKRLASLGGESPNMEDIPRRES